MQPKNLSQAISWYLMSCYLYYRNDAKHEPVLTDAEYDELCAYILKRINKVKKSKHIHAHLITKEGLRTSGFAVKIPKIVKYAARSWRRDEEDNI